MIDFNVSDTLLGKQASNPEQYDASLLFRIPRSENRLHFSIHSKSLPFQGFDVWNCYEFSYLTKNGLPVNRVIKLIYGADSEFLLESKSLKLYLNSFNMEPIGETVYDSDIQVKKIIQADLESLLETKVSVFFFTENSEDLIPFQEYQNLTNIIQLNELDSVNFSHFTETHSLLKGISSGTLKTYSFKSDLLRSNCRVTNQPDWGDLFICIESGFEIDLLSVVEYLVSFRKENHFHEEVVEMIFKRLMDKFSPMKLMVAAMYTRRGGIDINPIRVTHSSLVDEAFLSEKYRLAKTWRQ